MSDPFSGGPGGFDPRMFAGVPLFQELAKVLAWRGGPVNWDLATQTAQALVAARERDRERALPSGDREDDELAQAVSVAELWLDAVTDLPAVDGPARALPTGEWIRMANSTGGLGLYVEPVAKGMGEALTRGLGSSEELSGLTGGQGMPDLGGMLGPVGALLYGVQVGSITGQLADQLLGTYDLGVPTVDPRVVGTVGDSARRFAAEYDIDRTEFRYWLALREAAHRRQFAGVAWLRAHLADLVARFSAAADFDAGGLLESFGASGIDPMSLSDPARLRDALEGNEAFHVEPTPAQRAVLTQLQALVAFTEGWVEVVVDAAAGDKLPALSRIEEAITRRRAEKGAGERALEQLVGLDLKPADLRAGAAFCRAVLAARGQAGLDRAWRGAEFLPTAAELAEPSRWLVRLAADEPASGDTTDAGGLPEVPDDPSGLDLN
jgi:putative hydrolase